MTARPIPPFNKLNGGRRPDRIGEPPEWGDGARRNPTGASRAYALGSARQSRLDAGQPRAPGQLATAARPTLFLGPRRPVALVIG
jgi:hypothetical protein